MVTGNVETSFDEAECSDVGRMTRPSGRSSMATALSERSMSTQPCSHDMRTSRGNSCPKRGAETVVHGSYSPSERLCCTRTSKTPGQHAALPACWSRSTEPELVGLATRGSAATQYTPDAQPDILWCRQRRRWLERRPPSCRSSPPRAASAIASPSIRRLHEFCLVPRMVEGLVHGGRPARLCNKYKI